ncbi:GCN5 family acetyltransferase [Stenotrophomonas koreensis]|jgi:GNAT superfamily N-acetyltransferase|uniref:GCN5 family acetyltransferase n=1 Tax=Stenotrophomonas koreensis TaxID=266128 RepID=A0A0R0BSD1_9GAMM|nr:GCN5 family acetyltransferase [Stenotrophomonas koreensis]
MWPLPVAELRATAVDAVPGLVLRPATAADAGLILRFIIELAVYEKEPDAVVTDQDGIAASLFGQGATARALIAELDAEPVGYAVWFASYSTWLGRNGLYLEDLYVTPEMRGRGVGKAILRQLAALAVAQGCGRMEWSVLDWNAPAIAFYESVGARPQSEWTVFRLTGDALSTFAAGR